VNRDDDGWIMTSRLALALSACTLVAVLVGCTKPSAQPEPIRAVKLMTVGEEKLQSGAEFAAEVRAQIEVRPGFRVAGKVTQRAVEVGQRVKVGQLLAQLDAQDYVLASEAAKAQVTAAATNRNLAVAELKRFAALKDQNFISSAELERREAGVKAAEAQLELVQAQLSGQRNQVGYTKLISDVAGVILSVDAESGQVVAAGQPVVRIAKDGPRDVVFAVPEDKVGLIPAKSPVAVRVWGSNELHKATVREISAAADPITRTFQVKAAFQGGASPPLGATVTAVPQAFERKEVSVIKVPTSALKQDGKSTAVWLLDIPSMTVRNQPVEVSTADGNDAVIGKGLQPGMQIVVVGVHVLQAGQKVSIYKDKSRQAGNPIQAAPLAR
jgi:membrane fusion protein, multidrug efflux system